MFVLRLHTALAGVQLREAQSQIKLPRTCAALKRSLASCHSTSPCFGRVGGLRLRVGDTVRLGETACLEPGRGGVTARPIMEPLGVDTSAVWAGKGGAFFFIDADVSSRHRRRSSHGKHVQQADSTLPTCTTGSTCRSSRILRGSWYNCTGCTSTAYE